MHKVIGKIVNESHTNEIRLWLTREDPLIRAIADGGAVVVLCSTGNQELAELCDRVAVFYQGTMVGELTRLDQHVLLEAVNTEIVQEAA